jgi:cytochrome c2
MVKISLSILLMFFIVACSSSKTTTNSTVEIKKTTEDEISLAKLEQGRNLYGEKCSTCHKLKNPSNFDEESLKKIVPKMVGMANKRETTISTDEEDKILYYLLANAKK